MTQQEEQAFIYDLLNRLVGVTTPAEYLEIVSDYARSRGASGSTLVWLDDTSGDTPAWHEAAARWAREGAIMPTGPVIGARVPLEMFWTKRGTWLENPDQPTLVDDVDMTDLIAEGARALYLNAAIKALVFLPLRSGGRWISAITFRWAEAQQFTAADRRVFELIIRYAAPVINAVRLLQENRRRAARSEIIGEINTALSQASSEIEILGAICRYAERHGADVLLMMYVDCDPLGSPVSATLAALTGKSDARSALGTTFPIGEAFRSFLEATVTKSQGGDQPSFFEDYAADERLDAGARQVALSWGFKTGVMFPLRSAGRWQALIGVNWHEKRVFTDEEVEIYSRLLPTMASIVASRRSYLATQDASEEARLLYTLAESINAATTYQEITDAVAALYDDCDVFQIQLWENLDMEAAAHMDVVASTKNTDIITALDVPRFHRSLIPDLPEHFKGDLLIVEHAQTDERLSEELRNFYKSVRIGAYMASALRRGGRFLGAMSYYYSEQRAFSEHDLRLLSGFSEMVRAAVERIAAQIEIENARRRAEENREESELFYRLAESINAATTYEQVLVIVAELQKDFDSAFLAVPDSFDAYASELQLVSLAAEPNGEYTLSTTTMSIPAFPILDALRDRRLWALEDIETDPSIDAFTRKSLVEGLGMRAFLGVSFSPEDLSDYYGGFGFRYAKSRTFSDSEQRRMSGIGDLVQAAVQRIHSLAESESARALSEQDREEASLLYRLAQDINAALTYQEVADAVVGSYVDTEGVYIQVWDQLDYDRAEYYEVVAGAVRGNALSADADRDAPIAKSRLKGYYDQVRQSPRPWVIEDVMHDPRADANVREAYQLINVRSTMVIALQQGNRWLGSLSFRYSKERRFDERAKRLAVGIGELVQAAVERIGLQVETDSARQRAEVMVTVTAALAQATDENGVLAALALLPSLPAGAFSSVHYPVLDSSGELIGFQMQATNLPDGTYAPRDHWMDVIFRIEDFPTLSILAREPTHIIYLENYLTDPRPEYMQRLEHARDYGWLSVIAIPLWSGGRWQGNIQFAWREANRFGDELKTVLQALMPVLTSVVSARRSYLAAEQARQETEQRVNDLTTVAQVSAAAVSLLDESRLLSEFARLTSERFAPNLVRLYLIDERGVLHRTALKDSSEDETIPLDDDCFVARAARERKGFLHTQHHNQHLTSNVHDGVVDVLSAHSELAVPMAVRDRLIGVLHIESPVGVALGESHLRVMATLGDLIAVAVQNVRSYRQAQELAALEERTRLARELHDSVSQALYGIGLGAQTARTMLDKDPNLVRQPLEYVISLAQAGLTEMRALIFELRPETLENEGLVTALAKQGASLQARQNIQVQLELCDEPTLGLGDKESLYRIAREALHNVIKHAQATKVVLRLVREDEFLALDVIDNGRGFDTGRDFPGHLGLQSMRERVMNLGGWLEIYSAPGEGARVSARLPMG
jgi:signal transduction histidine kinase